MKYSDIPGWFNPIDQAAFAWTLEFQSRTEPPGNVVELGVFKGKSAVLIGSHVRRNEVFFACDLFDDIEVSSAVDPQEQGFFRTQSLTQAEFERNYLSFHRDLPRIVRGPTSVICDFVADRTARFVHVDAGHTYNLVREDTASARKMLRENGVVAFDDYIKVNTLGTGAAVWEAILNEGLKPIFNTKFKMYATWGDPKPLQTEIVMRAIESGWCVTDAPVMIRDMPMIFLHNRT